MKQNVRPGESAYSDEKGKLRLGQWGCLNMVTGSGFGESSVPQNLGSGQREEGLPTTFARFASAPSLRMRRAATKFQTMATTCHGVASILLGRIPEHCEVMACGTRHYKQMPDEVTVSQARIGRVESHTPSVSHASCDQPK